MPPFRFALATVLALLASLSVASTSAVADGPDYVASDNVEFVRTLRLDVGLTTGARIVGDRMFVTSGKNLSIYDISKPDDPQLIGGMHMNIAWENEEVPTNGKLLAISTNFYSIAPNCLQVQHATGCVQLFDVRDPKNIKELPAVAATDHTSVCALDCNYIYGSAGDIIDARGALDGVPAKVVGNWKTEVNAQGVKTGRCHNVREIRPGVLLTACQPFSVLSLNAEDGGSPEHPKVLATGGNADGRFIHSGRWPREGQDKFALIGGETNFVPRCGDSNGAFMVYDASQALSTGTFRGPLDEIRPTNGTYADGEPPINHLGCSVHWYQEHQSFHDGGLVALAEYESGTRFVQVTPEGKLVEQGFFEPLAGSASSPKWAPNSDIVYSIDYERGIDVLRWKGQHYVPGPNGKVRVEHGRREGTHGRQPVLPALTATQQAQIAERDRALDAAGWFPNFCSLTAARGD